MEKPTPKALREAIPDISQSYASMIVSGDRTPGTPLAIRIYRKLGWKIGPVANLTDEEIDFLERLQDRAA